MNQQYPPTSPAPPTSSKKSIWEYILLIVLLVLMGISFLVVLYGLGKLPWHLLFRSALIGVSLVTLVLLRLGKLPLKKDLFVRNQTVPSKKTILFNNWVYCTVVLIALGMLISIIVVSFIGAKERMRDQQRKVDMQFTETKEPKNGEDETANWKTYRNEEFGFEIKYPQDWYVVEIGNYEEGEIRFSVAPPIDLHALTIVISPTGAGHDLYFWEYTYQERLITAGSYMYQETFSYGDPPQEYPVHSVFKFKIIPSRWNSIHFIDFQCVTSQEDYNLLYQILSTFRFLE